MCLAIPGKLLSVEGEDPMLRMGKVSFGGSVREVNLSCVPEAKIGDYLLVHVGMAIQIVDEAEAQETFSYLALIEAAGQAEAERT
jgi:hydrogenase expression/formation protein HypC